MNLLDSLHHRKIEIPNEPGLRRFVVREYANGRPMLDVEFQTDEENVRGEEWEEWWPDMTVTINLLDNEIPEGCFFVRSFRQEESLKNLFATGLFEDLDVDIPAGFVEKYARVWRLKPFEPKGEGN